MSITKLSAGVAGACVLALAATTPPLVASAAPARADRPVELLGAAPANARTALPDAGVRARATTLDTAALDAARTGDRLSLGFFDDAAVTAVVDRRTRADGVTTWTGDLAGEQGTFTAVDVAGVQHITVASAELGTYEVTSTPTGQYVVTEAAPDRTEGSDVVVPDADAAGHAAHAGHGADARTTGSQATAGARTATSAATSADAATTIDVAIVYPAALVTQLGEGPMQAQFAQGIAQANQGFAASGIATQLRLVGTRQVAAAQLPIDANLEALATKGDGVFDEALALREETHADLVSFWMAGSDPTTCGLGYIGGLNTPDRDAEIAAFTSVYAADCATANFSFAHEVGHNLSADHDAGASSPPLSQGKPYAKGFVDVAGNVRTIMSYQTACQTCTRIGYYSNPNVLLNGRPVGAGDAFNAQAINEQIAATANFRQSQIYPGAVSIAGAARWKGKAKAVTGSWAPAVAFGYQWFLDGAPIPGATGDTYKLGRKTIGHSLSLVVTGSAPYYAAAAAGTPAVVVGKATFKTRKPKLRGVPRVGRVLSVSIKGWKPKPAKKSVKVRYQWMKNGKKIKGAKKSTYRVRGKDRGKKITVVVKVKKKGYETAKRSSKKVKIRR